jgi:hypothetical protein
MGTVISGFITLFDDDIGALWHASRDLVDDQVKERVRPRIHAPKSAVRDNDGGESWCAWSFLGGLV